jgi:hypothetical protein
MNYTLVILAFFFGIVLGYMAPKNAGYQTDGFTRVSVGYDYPYNDIKEMKGNASECAQECARTSGCTGFIRAPSANNCWLKRKLDGGLAVADRNGFMKEV